MSSPFPPEGFSIIRHFPHVWTPRHVGDVLTGYVCDPRPDCVGILVLGKEPDATSDHGPIEFGQVVHVRCGDDARQTLTALIEGEGAETKTYQVAVRSEGSGDVSVATRLVAPTLMRDAVAEGIALAAKSAPTAPTSAPAVAPPTPPAQAQPPATVPQSPEAPAAVPTPAPTPPGT